jgi:hypothetical protein
VGAAFLSFVFVTGWVLISFGNFGLGDRELK